MSLTPNGHRLVVRNGYHQRAEVATAAGAVPVRRRGSTTNALMRTLVSGNGFRSAILPAWARKSPQMTEALPLLYLHGLSTSDFGPALEQFLGSACRLVGPTITRLTTQWQGRGQGAFQARDLPAGVRLRLPVGRRHPSQKVRLEQDKLCLLVMIGVR